MKKSNVKAKKPIKCQRCGKDVPHKGDFGIVFGKGPDVGIICDECLKKDHVDISKGPKTHAQKLAEVSLEDQMAKECGMKPSACGHLGFAGLCLFPWAKGSSYHPHCPKIVIQDHTPKAQWDVLSRDQANRVRKEIERLWNDDTLTREMLVCISNGLIHQILNH